MSGSGKSIAHLVYILQAVSFLLGITFVIAVVINYVKRGDVRGTLAESHFLWQIRTFWWSLIWMVVGMLTMLIGGWMIVYFIPLWTIYRIVRGWLRLNDGREMYV